MILYLLEKVCAWGPNTDISKSVLKRSTVKHGQNQIVRVTLTKKKGNTHFHVLFHILIVHFLYMIWFYLMLSFLMQNYLKKKIRIPCFEILFSVSACSVINHENLITCFCNLFSLFFKFKCINTRLY